MRTRSKPLVGCVVLLLGWAAAAQPVVHVLGPNWSLPSTTQSARIVGTGFGTTADTSVVFTPAVGAAVTITPTSVTANEIVFTAPASGVGQASVAVRRAAMNSAASPWLVSATEGPRVTSISPNGGVAGSGSQIITFAGTNFLVGGAGGPARVQPGSTPIPYPGGGTTNTSSTPAAGSGTFGQVGTSYLFIQSFGGAVTLTSNLTPFTTTPTTVTSVNPPSAVVNSGPLAVTLSGTFPNGGAGRTAPIVTFQSASFPEAVVTVTSDTAAAQVVTLPNAALTVPGFAQFAVIVGSTRVTVP